MPRYGVALEDAYAAAITTGGHVTRGASRRAKVYDFMFGSDGTPADNIVDLVMIRHTTAPTSTAVVAEALDPADPAAITTAGENVTIEPTFGSESLMELPVNQRASYRWVAAPESELIIPDTANAGIAFRHNGPVAAGNFNMSVHYLE